MQQSVQNMRPHKQRKLERKFETVKGSNCCLWIGREKFTNFCQFLTRVRAGAVHLVHLLNTLFKGLQPQLA